MLAPATILSAQTPSVDDTLENVFGPIVDVLENIVFFAFPLFGTEVPVLIIWLLAGGIFMTAWLKLMPIRKLAHSIKIIRGQYNRYDDPGQVTSFQALATELSGTVGLGNIAGVAVAISLGGPGASLWIILIGLLGMSVKAAEAVLGQKFRKIDAHGTVHGGPMFYLTMGLEKIGRPVLGKILAYSFALFMMIGAWGAANLFQANQLAAQVIESTGGEDSIFAGRSWIIGVIVAVFVALVIFGGITSIARWTSRITPTMAVLYFLCVVVILLVNITELPTAIGLMFTGAFTGEGVTGGIVGVAIIGIQRALFSNAAGVGTAGVAHAATKNRRPAQEGFVAAWEPLIDSVIVCTLTGLAITVTGSYNVEGANGVELTSAAFGTVHWLFPILLTVCVILFAFSSMLSYAYYGRQAAGYFFGGTRGNRVAERVYDGVWVIGAVLGAAVSLDTVIRLSDVMFFLMTVPNLIGIYFLAKIVRREMLGHVEDLTTGSLQVVPLGDRSTMHGDPIEQSPTDPDGGRQPSVS